MTSDSIIAVQKVVHFDEYELRHMMTLFARVLLLLICFVVGMGSIKWFYSVDEMKSCNQCENGNQ